MESICFCSLCGTTEGNDETGLLIRVASNDPHCEERFNRPRRLRDGPARAGHYEHQQKLSISGILFARSLSNLRCPPPSHFGRPAIEEQNIWT
jgi:hypothetical protein